MVSQVLDAVRLGQRPADDLFPLVYERLRRLARYRLGRLPAGHTLQPTALVHEAYFRLVGKRDPGWQNVGHFFFAAARAMHDVLVDHARQKQSLKRGGGRRRLNLDELTVAHEAPCEELLALSQALEELASRDARKHQQVLLRFFAGCTTEQVAAALQLSPRTVERDWRYARAWLHARLSDQVTSPEGCGDGGLD